MLDRTKSLAILFVMCLSTGSVVKTKRLNVSLSCLACSWSWSTWNQQLLSCIGDPWQCNKASSTMDCLAAHLHLQSGLRLSVPATSLAILPVCTCNASPADLGILFPGVPLESNSALDAILIEWKFVNRMIQPVQKRWLKEPTWH
jgi:hypothetical protein